MANFNQMWRNAICFGAMLRFLLSLFNVNRDFFADGTIFVGI